MFVYELYKSQITQNDRSAGADKTMSAKRLPAISNLMNNLK